MKKNIIAWGLTGLVLIGIGLAVFMSAQKPKVVEQPQKKEEVGAIPTVDPSTVVSLEPIQGNKEIVLKGTKIPQGTESIDYELSYDTKGQGKQGVIGTVSDFSGSDFEKQMTLGTCSSGKCVYHEVIGAIQVTLRFTGGYGEKIFAKEFTL